jgi:capsular exopolysaccharide synthesis family protein
MKTIEQNLSSTALLERLIHNMNLTLTDVGLEPGTKPYSQNEMIRAFAKRISVKLQRGTRLISITVENENPTMAQTLSTNLVKEYIRGNLDQRVSVTQEANRFLIEEADRLKTKLQKSEQALQAYKEQNQAVSLEESQNITVAKLKELNAKVTDAKTQRLKLEADVTQVQKLGFQQPGNLLAIPSVAESKVVLEQKKSVTEQEGEIANFSQRYKPLHPKFIQAKSKLQELKSGLDQTIIKAAESVATAYEAAKETEAKFEAALKEQEQKALDLNKIAIPYNALAREVESDRALYNSVLTRLKETDVTKGIEQDNIRVVEPALTPDKPVKPRVSLILAGCLFGGTFLGVGICFGLDALDSSLKTVDQAEALLGLPAVAAVPKSDIGNSDEHGLLILREPHGAVAEAFRTLRTSLSLLGNQSDRRTFLFTSAIPGEGKSFSSTNCAIAFAQQGLRTLLIDADLRLPTVGKVFFNNNPHAGVSDVIAGQIPFPQAVRETDVNNLTVMTAGNRAPNPAELLAGTGFAELIKESLLRYDRVVIDSAPVNAVSDTLLLIKYISTVSLVIHAGKTPRKAVIRAVNKLADAGSRPVGFVLNRLPMHSGVNYYYYYSAGEYGKGVYGVSAQSAI